MAKKIIFVEDVPLKINTFHLFWAQEAKKYLRENFILSAKSDSDSFSRVQRKRPNKICVALLLLPGPTPQTHDYAARNGVV
jgi:hypothetical protein